MATGIYSAIHKFPVDHKVAMTGEISIHGNVKPIGGVVPKIKAAKQAGAKKVIIPQENMQSILKEIEGIEIIPVTNLEEVFEIAIETPERQKQSKQSIIPASTNFSKTESV